MYIHFTTGYYTVSEFFTTILIQFAITKRELLHTYIRILLPANIYTSGISCLVKFGIDAETKNNLKKKKTAFRQT